MLKNDSEDSHIEYQTDIDPYATTKDNSTIQNIDFSDIYEIEVQTLNGFYFFDGTSNLMALPDNDSQVISAGTQSVVKIITTVNNGNETWALIELIKNRYLFSYNYGYIPIGTVSAIKTNSETIYDNLDYFNVDGIKIGDSIEKAISLLDTEYVKIKNFDDYSFHFFPKSMSFDEKYYSIDDNQTLTPNIHSGLTLNLDPLNDRIIGLTISANGFSFMNQDLIGQDISILTKLFSSNATQVLGEELSYYFPDYSNNIIYKLDSDYFIVFETESNESLGTKTISKFYYFKNRNK